VPQEEKIGRETPIFEARNGFFSCSENHRSLTSVQITLRLEHTGCLFTIRRKRPMPGRILDWLDVPSEADLPAEPQARPVWAAAGGARRGLCRIDETLHDLMAHYDAAEELETPLHVAHALGTEAELTPCTTGSPA
jgi:hypothetical protein